MYKNIIAIVVTLFIAFESSAQLKKLEFLASVAGGINLNKPDISSTSTQRNLTLKNTDFFNVSVGIRVPFKRIIFTAASFGFAGSKENLNLRHPDDNSIYQEKFTNEQFFFKIITGLHFSVNKGGFDFGFGLINVFSKNSQASGTKIFYEENGNEKTINHTLQTNWGNNATPKALVPTNILAELQVAYINRSILPDNRMLRFALFTDIGLLRGGKRYTIYDNAAQVNYYNDNGSERTLTGTERYTDKSLKIGVEVMMSF